MKTLGSVRCSLGTDVQRRLPGALGASLRELAAPIMVIAFAFFSLAAVGHVSAAQAQGDPWAGAWAASPAPAQTNDPTSQGFAEQTIRMVVRVSAGGRALRVRLSNAFGTGPVTFDAAAAALQDEGADLKPNTPLPVTFGGQTSVTIRAGGDVYSDPVLLATVAGDDVAITLYVFGPSGPVTSHGTAWATTWVAEGDHLADESGAAFTTTHTSWFWLSGITVANSHVTRTVVMLGDSITDGFGSTIDENTRYPDFLARRLMAQAGGPQVSVLNSGIGGNRILHDYLEGNERFGVKAVSRFDRDVVAQPGVTDIILQEGINDIGISELAPGQEVSAPEIIEGMRNMISRARLNGLRIYGGTLLPFQGAVYYTDEGEAKRQAVNQWIRTGGEFDAIIDFDEALRDTDNPLQFRAEYDSGDHLHPNVAGYNAMAEAVDLRLFDSEPTDCTCDGNADQRISIDELVDGVNNALIGCP